MRRRAFLLGAASAIGVSAAGDEIVDTHIHIYDPSRPEGVPWPPKNDSLLYKPHLAQDFHAAVADTPVRKAVIIEASPWHADNDWILARARENPAFVCVVGNLRPGTANFATELARLRQNRLFRGIRIGGPAVEKSSVEDLRRVADAGLSIDVLTGSDHFAHVSELAAKIPNGRFILDHLPLYPSPKDALRNLEKAPNLYIKVSAVDPRSANNTAALDELRDLFGPKRLVYGSNWPVSNRLGPYAEQFRVVSEWIGRQTAADRRAFFHDNAKAVYRWP